MKNTTKVMAVMINEEKEFTWHEITSNTDLNLSQTKQVLRFLKKGRIIYVRHIKTNSFPYKKALYSLNQEKYEKIIKLIERDGLKL